MTHKNLLSLPSRGAWIEIFAHCRSYYQMLSLPSRGAWIEMCRLHKCEQPMKVAPLAGSVDRNREQGETPLAQVCRSPRGERG